MLEELGRGGGLDPTRIRGFDKLLEAGQELEADGYVLGEPAD